MSATVPAPAALTSPDQDGMVQVRMPSGGLWWVHEEEVDYFAERVDLYMRQNHFPNISDLQDVDRLLQLELFVYRWGTWLSRQKTWWGDTVDDDKLGKAVNAYSTELRQLKKQLGLDKATRDRQKGEDSVSNYIQNLLIRAKEFGVMREQQLAKSLELFNQLKALVTLYRNCDDTERREMHVTQEDVIEWLETVAFPEYDDIDAYFREHQQRIWVRKM